MATGIIGATARRGGVVALVAGALAVSAMGETLTYVLTPDPTSRWLKVELTWQTEGRSSSMLCVASRWGTLHGVAGVLKDMRIDGATSVRRDGACWRVAHGRRAALCCRYTVDAGQSAFDWAHANHPLTTEGFFHGAGAAFLMVPATGGGMPAEYEVLLRWRLPKGWEAVSSWGAGRHVGALLGADDLRHSVYLAGDLVTDTRAVRAGASVTVAMVDAFGFKVGALGKLAAGIIGEQCAFMGEEDFPPFVVTVVPMSGDREGEVVRLRGLGLYRSLALSMSLGAKLTDAVEHLFAHELFHQWNGRLLRGAEPLEATWWLTEGFTDYYAMRSLYESGRWTAGTYAKWLNRHLGEYNANPARNATNEQVVKRARSAPETYGQLPYQRGLMLGLRWHRQARERGVEEGVDRLFRELMRRARDGGFEVTNAVVRAVGVEVYGGWFEDEFDGYVVRGETVAVPADALGPDLMGEVRTVYAYALGFDRGRSLREQRIHGLVPGSAAAAAGLREGDVLAGWDVHGDADRRIRLQVRRGGKAQEIRYYPRGVGRELLQFRPARKAGGGRAR